MFVFLAAITFAAAAPADFGGHWKLLGSSGANAPREFFVTVQQSGGMLQFDAHWEEPPNGQYGLTLIGVITQSLRISTAGQEDLNQVGPFVFRSRSHWEKDKLVTEWNTSAYMSQWFKGTWTRSLSADGKQMLVDVAALSSAGKRSHASLIFGRE